MIKLLIIADDFTGGLDTGVQFAAKGIRTCVVTDPGADFEKAADGNEVLVVVAETRHMPAGQAYNTVYRVVEKSVALGIPHIYKKTDSALRGNIGAELSAVLDASGEKTLMFVPAMPGIRRITVGGVHSIDGVPVAQSVFGKDPFEPVRESDVTKLIALQSKTPTWKAAPDSIPQQEGIVIVDAQSDEDLCTAGRTLQAMGALRVTAGCAGFGAVLPKALGLHVSDEPKIPGLAPGLFVLCGSVNPITQRQLAKAEKEGFARVHIRPDQKLTEGYFDTAEGRVDLESWRIANRQAPWMILDANDLEDGNKASAAYAAAHHMSMEDVRRSISGALGRILPRMLDGMAKKTVLITGGDTLLQCMNAMRVTQMEPLLEVFPGVVLSRFTVDGQPQLVITKSGGFGKETLLCDLKKLIEDQQNQK
ncbi:MAG: four-carbon acid sugar kinase family protein [Clostridia bacterium]|nr:four-carbon acid sugar kinase family protein [Clostridia bacterium]